MHEDLKSKLARLETKLQTCKQDSDLNSVEPLLAEYEHLTNELKSRVSPEEYKEIQRRLKEEVFNWYRKQVETSL